MQSLFCKLLSLLFLANQLLYAQSLDDKLEKSTKPSLFKQKLAKADPIKVAETDPLAELDTEPISELGITVPPEFSNASVKVVKDTHTYYNSTFYSDPDIAKQFWVDLDSPNSHAVIQDMLSNSHRQASNVELSFEFPFYGHTLRNITIATGGFLYMGDYLHNWIAATQYVAPLMANFDSSLSPSSFIKYADNGTAFTAQWENLFIQDHMDDGAFTFQVTLLDNGDMYFAYKNIPQPIANISDTRHPVKVGISDAYILERTLFFVRRKTIYEYHRVDLLKRDISNNTALHFTALPTCPGYKDCNSCLAADAKMECRWCEAVNRCSDGIDRSRQTWVSNGCTIQKTTVCPAVTVSTSTAQSSSITSKGSDATKGTEPFSKTSKFDSSSAYHVDSTAAGPAAHGPAHYIQESSTSYSSVTTGAIVTIVAFVVALVAAGMWIGYAYKFPQTPSGQFLIKYRPSQWSMRGKGETTGSSNSRHF